MRKKKFGNAWERKRAFKQAKTHKDEGAYEGGPSISADTIWLPLDLILLSEKNREALVRDGAQIDEMRRTLEKDQCLVPILVWKRPDGFYEIEDGRHRYLAHERAGRTLIECVLA